jgi:mRNA-degrading endonuclease RelE of RelBE toxin-antitoxin system
MSPTFKEIVELPEFQKDLKKLTKRYPTLRDDLHIFVQIQLNLYHKKKIDNGGIFPLASLKIDYPKFYKAKKFSSRSLKGKGARSGIRIIYAYFNKEDRIEFVEIYFKGDKEIEDRERIIRNYSLP